MTAALASRRCDPRGRKLDNVAPQGSPQGRRRTMKRNYRCWHVLLIMGGGLLLFWATPICLISLSQKLQGAAPCGGGVSYSGWAFYGREHLRSEERRVGKECRS